MTCGGLCPGINSVVREIYNTLHHLYGVEEVYGSMCWIHFLSVCNECRIVPFGYRGFYSPELDYLHLTV